jgi:hypothetical protein
MSAISPTLKAMIDYNNREVAAVYAFAGDDHDTHDVAREATAFVRAGFALTPPVINATAAILSDMYRGEPEKLRPFLDNLKAVLAALDQ